MKKTERVCVECGYRTTQTRYKCPHCQKDLFYNGNKEKKCSIIQDNYFFILFIYPVLFVFFILLELKLQQS